MAHVFLPSTADVDYQPTGGASWTWRRANVFQPRGKQPANGWPCVVWFNSPGLASSSRATTISQNDSEPLMWLALRHGWVVVAVETTPSNSTMITSAAPDGLLNNGKGFFIDPVGDPTDFADKDMPTAEKDAAYAFQYFRYNASTHGIDPNRMYVYGRSGGSVLAAWIGLGPDRAVVSDATDPFLEESSRPSGVVLELITNLQPLSAIDSLGNADHFAHKDGGGGPAGDLDDVPLVTLRNFGISHYAFTDSAIQTLNYTQPVHIYTGGTFTSTDFAQQSEPYGLFSLADTLTDLHDAWNAWGLRKLLLALDISSSTNLHGQKSRLTIDHSAYAAAPVNPEATHTTRTTLARKFEQMAWLQQINARTPVKELVLLNVQGTVEDVLETNGYTADVEIVERDAIQPQNLSSFPAVLITEGFSNIDEPGVAATGLIAYRMPFEIVAFDSSGDDKQMNINRLLMDIHKALLLDESRGGYAAWTRIEGERSFVPDGIDELFSGSLECSTFFMTEEADLTVPAS